jgi:RNA polymerase sigma factor (TIGR02999 family)
MGDVTRILFAIEQGDSGAADKLFPLVYNELRRLATHRLSHEKPGQTLQATALVHEVYIRLVDVEKAQQWNSRGHFFSAAAEAMRRLLVENARRKARLKHGGGSARRDMSEIEIAAPLVSKEILAVDEALEKLASVNPTAAQLVKLRYFAGFTMREASEVLHISLRKAEQVWAYARAWLLAEMGDNPL